MNHKNQENQTPEPSKRIAVIEDDSTIKDLVEDFLQDEGYDYESFASPEEFHKSNTKSFNVIISDILLQDRRTAGVDLVVKYIEECSAPEDKKVIFISNFGRDSLQPQLDELEKYGCQYTWLSKPFSMLDLFEEIETGEKR